MKPSGLIAVSLLWFALMPGINGQDEEQPLSPVLDMVTVDPQDGFATLRWILSSSPDVAGYVIYTLNSGTASAIDTVRSPYETVYIHTLSLARYKSVTYVVAAIDSALNISLLSNSLSTIYLTAVNDSCNSRITMLWTQYDNALHPADSYEVRVAIASGSAVLHETIPVSETSYNFIDYDPGTNYCFHITASDDGSGLSSSNRVCVTTGSEVAPAWVNADAVAVTGREMIFIGSYDQATSFSRFVVQQYSPATSSWENIISASGSGGIVIFSAVGADTASVRLYRITALNNCDVPVVSSGSVRNMVLTSAVTGTRIDLKWNNPLPDGETLFTVWRETGQGWEEVATHLSDTIWTDDYSLFAADVSASEVAYQITAVATDAPEGAPLHRSSVTTIEVTENIFVPNAFTPGRGIENATFRPEFSFLPVKYEFRIYTRSGSMLFQTSDYATGWDGLHNGTMMPSGVYLWSLKLTTPSGGTEVRTGTVTILP